MKVSQTKLAGESKATGFRPEVLEKVIHRELENELIPVVRNEYLARRKAGDWAEVMIAECRDRLGAVLPMAANEIAFLDRILDQGEIEPELLTTDGEMAERIRIHPLLQWKAVNVRKHRKV